MILEKIYEKMIRYEEQYNDKPNTVLLPIAMYEALQYYARSMFAIYYDESIEHKVFDMDIIVVNNREDIKVIKVIKARLNDNE